MDILPLLSILLGAASLFSSGIGVWHSLIIKHILHTLKTHDERIYDLHRKEP